MRFRFLIFFPLNYWTVKKIIGNIVKQRYFRKFILCSEGIFPKYLEAFRFFELNFSKKTYHPKMALTLIFLLP